METEMILGIGKEKLNERKAIFTAEEIAQQPDVWRKTATLVESFRPGLDEFIAGVTEKGEYDIILTGAGTSEYVGMALQPALLRVHDGKVHSIGTTDIVASPTAYLSPERPTLLVSFARSGNSPESVGAVMAADTVCNDLRHLFITCNAEGELAKAAEERDNCFSIVLTPETNDRSFAMTSSFSGMYVAALLALAPSLTFETEAICGAAESFLGKGYEELSGFIGENDFERIVYLGTDVLKGIARESSLKVLELTAGKMAAFWDTPMGFRHGPKSIVDDGTVTVVFISDDPYTRMYELDVLEELYRDKKNSKVIALYNIADERIDKNSDLAICAGMTEAVRTNRELALAYIVIAQSLAMLYSLKLGLTPDDPCPTGEVNRVVQGVTIYPLQN